MASPIPEDDHLYAPLKDLRIEGSWGGAKEGLFSVWLFPLRGVKAGPLIFLTKDSAPSPLLSLTSNQQVALHPLGSNQGNASLHSNSRIPLLRWSHVALRSFGNRLQLLLDGKVEVDTKVSETFSRMGPLLLSGAAKPHENRVYTFNPILNCQASTTEEEGSSLPVQLVLCPRSQNPKTASGTDVLEFRPSTIDGEQVFAVVGGKPSCRRKFVINVELVDARGRCVAREIDVVATLVFADSELPVPGGGNGAEAPLLTTFDGVEFPSDAKPTRLVNGKASFKFTISQLASKCENRLFSICFQAFPPRDDRPYLRLLSKPIHSISRKRPNKSREAPYEGGKGTDPAKKRIRKDGVLIHEVQSDLDDSRSSETDTKPAPEILSKFSRAPHSLTPAQPSGSSPSSPRSPRGNTEVELQKKKTGLGLFGYDLKENGAAQKVPIFQGGAFAGSSGGVVPPQPWQGEEISRVLDPFKTEENEIAPEVGHAVLPQRMASLPESGRTYRGMEGQAKAPPQVGEGSKYTRRVAAHASVIQTCAIWREGVRNGPNSEGDDRTAEMRLRQATEYSQLRALLAERKEETALEQLEEESRIQGLEEKIEALQTELRASVAALCNRRQQLMDENAEVTDLLLTHLLPPMAFLINPGQSQADTSAISSQLAAPIMIPPGPSPDGNPRPSLDADVTNPRRLPYADVSRQRRASPALPGGLGSGNVLGGQFPRQREPPGRTQPLLNRFVDRLVPSPSAFCFHEMGGRISDVERHIEWPRIVSPPPRRPVLDLMEQPHVQDDVRYAAPAGREAGGGGGNEQAGVYWGGAGPFD